MVVVWIYRIVGYEFYFFLGGYFICRVYRLNDRMKNLLVGKIVVFGD